MHASKDELSLKTMFYPTKNDDVGKKEDVQDVILKMYYAGGGDKLPTERNSACFDDVFLVSTRV